MTARHFALTINLGKEPEYVEINARVEYEEVGKMCADMVDDGRARFICMSLEKGEQGNYHCQVYLQVQGNSKRATQVKGWFGIYHPHVEVCGGSDQDNVDYVKAEGKHANKSGTTFKDTIISWGVQGKMGKENQRKRNDLLVLQEALNSGKTEREICDELFPTWCRNFRQIDRWQMLHPPERTRAPDVEVHVGAPGTGKTRSVFDAYPQSAIFNVPRSQGTAWFDGYDARTSKVTLFDDFYGWCPYDFILRVTDRYPVNTQVKGSFRPFVCDKIVFTSNKPPMEWYRDLVEKGKVDFGAFLRRVTRWVAYHPGGIVYDGADYAAFSAALAMVPMRARAESEATEILDE